LLAGLVIAVAFVAGFGAGQMIDVADVSVPDVIKSADKPNKPSHGLVIQGGDKCNLIDRSGYKAGDKGCPVAVGEEFSIGFHTVRAGWSITLGKDRPVLTAVIANDNPGAVSGFYHSFYLNRYDGSMVELLSCDSPAFAAGESRTVVCAPGIAEGSHPFDTVAINL
jgi:hypothetical protein